jgi:hypothetical protein
MTEDKELIIFKDTEVKAAIDALIKGRTNPKYIKQRPGRGGGNVNYVETYYVVDQLNKIFAFRWDFEILEENVTEKAVDVKGRLTAYLKDNTPISKTQYGEADRQQGVPLGDTKKGAASDCLKKCASLFGIAIDVYWGKELELFSKGDDGEKIELSITDGAKQFNMYVKNKHLTYSKVFEILGIKDMTDITDFEAAYNKLKGVVG